MRIDKDENALYNVLLTDYLDTGRKCNFEDFRYNGCCFEIPIVAYKTDRSSFLIYIIKNRFWGLLSYFKTWTMVYRTYF